MSDHGGQMPGGIFDVKELWVTEPPTADAPAEAIPEGGDFTLNAKFTGGGTQWKNMKKGKHHFHVMFHLEGLGQTEDEVDYGPVHINVSEAADIYEAKYDVNNNTLAPGLYDVGCTVENKSWTGAVGYFEGLKLHIYEE